MSLSKLNEYMLSWDLPEEILSEVFKRLPVKDVIRCGGVQKSWYLLIKTPTFISLHRNYQKMTAPINPKYLLFHDTINGEITLRSDDAKCQQYGTFNYPLDLPASTWFAQSNGLFCVSTMFDKHLDYNPEIYIWNPLVQKFKTVPDLNLSTIEHMEIGWKGLAFGFLPEADDYVVVHISNRCPICAPTVGTFGYGEEYEQYQEAVMISVYSLNTNSWKKICQAKFSVDDISPKQSVFVNGTAFWVGVSSYNHFIMSFDTKKNILQKIMLPGFNVTFGPLLFPFGQAVAYFVEVDPDDVDREFNEDDPEVDDDDESPHLDIWLLKLKDYLIGEFSWEKKISVSLTENVRTKVLGLRNNGDPILAKSNNFISYDLHTHEPFDFVESSDFFESFDSFTTTWSYSKYGFPSTLVICPFVETLTLLDIDCDN